VFANVTRDNAYREEEIFGPVLSILTYKTEAEAIEIANDTNWALSLHVSSAVRKGPIVWRFQWLRLPSCTSVIDRRSKISSFAIRMSRVTLANTVGLMKFPTLKSLGMTFPADDRAPQPSSTPDLMYSWHALVLLCAGQWAR